MKNYLVILFLSLSLVSWSYRQADSTAYLTVSAPDSRMHMKQRLLYCDGLLFTGKLVKLYDSGDTLSVTEYLNGMMNGKQVSYYAGGKINEERYYIFGKKEGEHKGWWENSNQRFVYHFKDDEFEGNVRMWNQSGMLFNDFNYSKGHEEGMQKSWFEDGKLRANYEAKNNRKYGLTGVKNCKSVTDETAK